MIIVCQVYYETYKFYRASVTSDTSIDRLKQEFEEQERIHIRARARLVELKWMLEKQDQR